MPSMPARHVLARSRLALTPSPRSFSAGAGRRAGKEDKLHHEGRAAETETEKHASLRQQREGKGEWKEDLGSSSESIVKAERGEMKSVKESVAELQEEAKRAGGK